MRFSINLPTPAFLPGLEDDLRGFAQDAVREAEAAWARIQAEASRLDLRVEVARIEQGIEAAIAATRPAEGFEAAFQAALDRAGLGDLGPVDPADIDALAGLATRLPPGLAGPERTPLQEVAADIPREAAEVAAILSAAPRIVEWLGEDAVSVEVRGLDFAVIDTYRDPLTGFLGLRLGSAEYGEVFAVDGLIVGSRADEVAAATLGRLQVGSAEFARMVQDAASVAAADVPVTFAGPSLGGAIAQAAAHETARAVLATAEAVEAGALRLVTVDALGGRDAAEWIAGGALDPAALGLLTALNLRTEGDLISQIGSHVGQVLTLPAVDREGNPVALNPADAHVNVDSLLRVLGDDALFAQGVPGDPGEIGGFARASALLSEEAIAAWLRLGTPEGPPGSLQVPGEAGFDATGTLWSLDANRDGEVDIAVRLAPPDPLIG